MKAKSATLPSLHQTPPGLLHSSALAASTKKLVVSGVHLCRLGVNIMTSSPRLHAAMALHSRPKGHHYVPRGSSSSQSPCLCQRRRSAARSRTALHRASKTATRAQPTRTVDAPLTQMDGRNVFDAVSGTDTWTLRERSKPPSRVKEQVSHSSETRKLSMFLSRRSRNFRKDILLSASMSNS